MINISEYKSKIYTDEAGTALPFRLYDPNLGANRPLLVFLHGAGERGVDNESTLNTVSPFAPEHNLELEKYGSFLLAPQCACDYQWVDTPWANGSFNQDEVKISKYLSAAKSLIDSVVEEYKIDKSRIYIMGCSMGGYGTWDMLMRFPGYFRAAMPICGAADPSKAHLLAKTPIWTFHGDADNAVPVSGTREMYAAVKAAGGDIIYSEYKDCGHGVWMHVHRAACVYDWLFSR